MEAINGPLRRVGQALADPIRQSILVALLDGPMFSSDLADTVRGSRSNVSNHLACLRGCGLVATETVGRRVQYSLVSPALRHALQDLLTLEAEVLCTQMTDVRPQAKGGKR